MRRIKRHDRSDILIHWFNAACWLALLVTGVGLLDNPQLNPAGDAYPGAVRSLFGGGPALLNLHIGIGIAWMAGILLYVAVNFRGAVFFLKEIFSVSPARDVMWMVKKMALMTVGSKPLAKAGLTPDLPDQGYYNMGQKAFAQASVLGGVAIAATGVVMSLSDMVIPASMVWLVGWSVTLHYLAVGLVFAGLLVHVYMAAVSRDERPGFVSMFTGHVPEEYARHHHKLWLDGLTGDSGGHK